MKSFLRKSVGLHFFDENFIPFLVKTNRIPRHTVLKQVEQLDLEQSRSDRKKLKQLLLDLGFIKDGRGYLLIPMADKHTKAKFLEQVIAFFANKNN